MTLFNLSFLIGNLLLQNCSVLPSPGLIMAGILAFLLIFWVAVKKLAISTQFFCLAGGLLLGFVWTAWYAGNILTETLPKSIEAKTILIQGKIASLVLKENNHQQFYFQINNFVDHGRSVKLPILIRLSQRNWQPQFHVGETWQFLVRLKQIHGSKNPGGFDYEAWALQKKLRATGYILESAENKLLKPQENNFLIDQCRENLADKLSRILPDTAMAKWLKALVLGIRSDILPEDWQILRKTGTNHLMVIAGLHIGLLAGFAYVAGLFLWRPIPYLLLYLPAQKAAAISALFVGLSYSALAGFTIPTQRACLMLSIFMLSGLMHKSIKGWHALTLAMFIVLILNPLVVITASFWLSFVTIAWIIYGTSGRLQPAGLWWKWGRIQWVIGLGLMPLTIFFFHECSLISFVANSLAIPWLGFLVLPFCFLGCISLFFPPLAKIFFYLANQSLTGLWFFLSTLSEFEYSAWQASIPNIFSLILALSGVALFLLPAGFPGRYLGVFCLLPVCFYQPNKPQINEFWLTMLDVGQGLATVIQTKNHLLIYDTGPKFNAASDSGQNIVLPFLQTLNSKQIDKIIISHGDNDHIGGVKALQAYFPVQEIITSAQDKIPSAKPCIAGKTWNWDGVKFSMIYPPKKWHTSSNNASCVLKIDNGSQRALLPGDIERAGEMYLVAHRKKELASDILIVPHHGSKTSSTTDFIKAVNPKYALFAVGYRNRYHFPQQKILNAYTKQNVVALTTIESGAIQIKLMKNTPLRPQPYRKTHAHYWDHNP